MVKNILRYCACVVLLLAALASLLLATHYVSRRQFATSQEQLEVRAASPITGSNISVALIGDSWVSHKLLDDFLIAELTSHGWHADIRSFGHPGAVSRSIYEDLFKPEKDLYSSRNVLFGNPVQIGVIVAGVNDSIKFIGPDFYACHITMIVDAFKKRGIFPMIS